LTSIVASTAMIRPKLMLVVRPVFFTRSPTVTLALRRQARGAPPKYCSRVASWKSTAPSAASTTLLCRSSGICGANWIVMKRSRVAIRSTGSVPPSKVPGCTIGLPSCARLESASTWLLDRM
jgi:hypothetical protein